MTVHPISQFHLPPMPIINRFTDPQNREITLVRRDFPSIGQVQLRAYDTTGSTIASDSELPMSGHIGLVNLKVESIENQGIQLKLQDILIPQNYRNSHIANEMLDQSINVAKEKGASRITGIIENNEAAAFWKHMESKGTGWKVEDSLGAHGAIVYDLSGEDQTQISSTPETTQLPSGLFQGTGGQVKNSDCKGSIQESKSSTQPIVENEKPKDENQEYTHDHGYGY